MTKNVKIELRKFKLGELKEFGLDFIKYYKEDGNDMSLLYRTEWLSPDEFKALKLTLRGKC